MYSVTLHFSDIRDVKNTLGEVKRRDIERRKISKALAYRGDVSVTFGDDLLAELDGDRMQIYLDSL
jgi:hypothetical protein